MKKLVSLLMLLALVLVFQHPVKAEEAAKKDAAKPAAGAVDLKADDETKEGETGDDEALEGKEDEAAVPAPAAATPAKS